jgi:RNA-binding protein 5/10
LLLFRIKLGGGLVGVSLLLSSSPAR